MRIEQLSAYIVPLFLLGLYALTWVLNRDAQPLPPRPVRRESDDPPGSTRPGTREAPRDLRDLRGSSGSTASGPNPFAPRAGRPMPPAFDRSAGREGALEPGDAIVFTESEPNRTPGTVARPAQSPSRGAQNRRTARAKAAGGPRPRARAVPETTRELTQEVSTSMAQLKGKPLELTPLNLPLSPLTSLPLAHSGSSSMSAAAPTPQFSKSAPGLLDFRKTLADPARLREIIVWNELMQPPLALRRGPYRRP